MIILTDVNIKQKICLEFLIQGITGIQVCDYLSKLIFKHHWRRGKHMRLKILDYIDFERANTLLEGFSKSTGFLTAILDLEGNVLSKSKWRRTCTDFHRKNSETSLNCMESDTILANQMLQGEEYHFYKCHNGLVDVAIPIIIRGEHIANLFTGQFFFDEPDIAFFKNQAILHGFDETSYLSALGEVPVVSKEKVEVAMGFLKDLIQMIIEMTVDKLDQLELTTKIKARETSLLKNQIQLKQTVEDLLVSQRLSHLGTWRLNLETDQVDWSDELYKMYGFDSTLPPPLYTEQIKLFTKESWDKVTSSIELTRTTGIPYELELEMVNQGRPSGWMWVWGEAVKDSSGRITGLRGAAQDISDRKRVEESLADSQAFLQAAFDNSQAGIIIADAPDGKLRYVNKASLMIRDKSEDEIVKNIDIDKYVSSWNLFHLEGTPYKTEEVPLARAVLYGETTIEELIIRRDNSEDRVVLANAAPIKDARNNIKAGIVVMLDVTEKKHIDEKLIESELNYKALFDYSGVGIAYHTTDGHVISYNKKAAENMGGSSADFEGKSIFDLFPKEIAELYLNRITICASSNESQYYDDFVQLPTGDFWFYSTYTRILDAKGFVKGVQIVSNDISELKEKEKEIIYLSYHDQLTGLYNRRFFDEELLRLDTSRNLPLTIGMGDVNGLKLVNDSFGHKTGDQLLICVANVLRKACRQDDIIARVGGDEFSIIFPKTNKVDADLIMQRIIRLISQEKVGPLEFSIAFSFETKTSDESIDSIIKKAEDHMYRNKLNDISSLRNSTIRLIMNTLFEKNSRELNHSERVSNICVDIASALGFEKNEINHVRSAGLMHDIGKIGIDELVLNSETKLSDIEWKEVKKHSEIGFRILSSAPDFLEIAEDVFSHHERWDGKGYPRGINGEAISIYARIITIADAFDAMISVRPYRKGVKSLSVEDAINEIKKNAGTQFDPAIARTFVEKVLKVTW